MTARPPLAAVPDPDDADPDDALDPTFSEITDTELSFVGALGGLSLDKKTSALIVPLIVDPQNPLSHRDVARLRFRHLHVTITPVARTADGHRPVDPRVDPVTEAVHARRIDRMVGGWVVDDAGDDPPTPNDLA